ncbi:MAG: hypothetical protein M3Y35_13545 [Actinomycetota bacterium]|nr:hypothetical protein [Actinomycetota bacterium]
MRRGAPAGTAADGAELFGELGTATLELIGTATLELIDAATLELIELADGAADLLGLLDTAPAVGALTTLVGAPAALPAALGALLLQALSAAHSAIRTAEARVLAGMVLPLVFPREIDPATMARVA